MAKVRLWEVTVLVVIEANEAEEAVDKVEKCLEDYNSDYWVDIQEVRVATGGLGAPEELYLGGEE